MFCTLIFQTIDTVCFHENTSDRLSLNATNANVGTSLDAVDTSSDRTRRRARRERTNERPDGRTRWKTKENDADDARADDRDEW